MADLIPGRAGIRMLVWSVCVMAVVGVAPVIAQAQSSDLQSLIQKVDRLQRELSTLQGHVFAGKPIPEDAGADVSRADQSEQIAPTVAARLHTRLDELEAQLRSLTGQIEEANFRATQVTSRLDKLVGDVDFRLQQLEQRMQLSGGAAGAPAATAPTSLDAGGAQFSSAQPRTIGEVSQADVDALRQEKVEQSAALTAPRGAGSLPGGTVQADYDYAFGLLRQANYGEAEQALKAFLDRHPNDPLAGNAMYWLGETYYVRADYQRAAVTFAQGFQTYPDSQKAADNLLKLGMSLAQLNKKEDACGTFSEVAKRYPNAAANILQRAKRERERLGC